jgi:AraC-like DNA-binding protein/ligand-binding sensor protein
MLWQMITTTYPILSETAAHDTTHQTSRIGSTGGSIGESSRCSLKSLKSTRVPGFAKSGTAVSPSMTSAASGKSDPIIQAIRDSELFKEYHKAFTKLTGLPLAILEPASWQLPHHGNRNENPFCALIAARSSACAACVSMKMKLCEKAASESQTDTCPYGLAETAVPIKAGSRLVGFLHTGQALLGKAAPEQFEKIRKQLAPHWDRKELAELEVAYQKSKVVDPQQYKSVVVLLNIFAKQVEALANQLMVTQAHAEPPVITRAKAFIKEHQHEDLTLTGVSKALHMSPFYFCKLFRKWTGITFTNYLSRIRIETAKEQLLNPHVRISEVAYDIGFQSLTHFNRVFRKVVGLSPTQYRIKLPAAAGTV